MKFMIILFDLRTLSRILHLVNWGLYDVASTQNFAIQVSKQVLPFRTEIWARKTRKVSFS